MTEQDFKTRLKDLGLIVSDADLDAVKNHVGDLAAMIAYLDDRLTFYGEPSNVLGLKKNKPNTVLRDQAS